MVENLRRMQHVYKQVDETKLKNNRKEYFNKINNSYLDGNNNITNSNYHSISKNNNIITKSISRNNPILGIRNNMTSNDIISMSSNNLKNSLKYTGYRFDEIKNLAELIELNGTFKKKIPSANSEIYVKNKLSKSSNKIGSAWDRFLSKTPNKFETHIKISNNKIREITNGKRVLNPEKDVSLL